MCDIAMCVSNANKEVTVFDTIDAIKEAGFNSVFIQWYNKNWNVSQEEQLKYIKKCGLKVIFAHLGYKDINNLWLENELGDELIESYKNDIRMCKQNNIPMVVMHLSDSKDFTKYNNIGLKRLRDLVQYAKKLDIKIAFENTKAKDCLEYVLDNIISENVGVCFDSGHYHVYFDDKLDFDRFRNRIFAVHLHDNDKSADQHLIPFDGTINWDIVLKFLKKCNYKEEITLELCYRNKYLNMNIKEFYKKGYCVGKKLYNKFHNNE